MADNTTPLFPISYKSNTQLFSTANAGANPAGTIATVVTFAKKGRLDRIVLKASTTTTAGILTIWIQPQGGGTWRILNQILVSAITVTTALGSFQRTYCSGIRYQQGDLIGVSTEKAESFTATGYWTEDET